MKNEFKYTIKLINLDFPFINYKRNITYIYNNYHK